MASAIRKYLPSIALLMFLWSLFSGMVYFWLLPQQNNFDFYPRWAGVNEMFRGQNPYDLVFSEEYTEQKGYPRFVSQYFFYPATIAWILLPFWLLPIDIAVSLWGGLQLLLILLLPLLVFSLLGWRLQPLVLAGFILVSSIGNYHAVNVFILGQFLAFILACLVIAWWQIVEGNAWLAALALVGATIRPEGCVFVAVVLLDQLLHRRFKVVMIWLTAITIIFLLTVLQIGFWVPDFLSGVDYYGSEGIPSYPTSLLGPKVVSRAFSLLIVGWGMQMFKQAHPLPDRSRLLWVLSTAIPVALLVLPQTHDYTLLYALLPIWFVIWLGRQSLFVPPLCLLAILFSWYVMATDTGYMPQIQQFWVPLCLVVALTFFWLRAQPVAERVTPIEIA